MSEFILYHEHSKRAPGESCRTALAGSGTEAIPLDTEKQTRGTVAPSDPRNRQCRESFHRGLAVSKLVAVAWGEGGECCHEADLAETPANLPLIMPYEAYTVATTVALGRDGGRLITCERPSRVALTRATSSRVRADGAAASSRQARSPAAKDCMATHASAMRHRDADHRRSA